MGDDVASTEQIRILTERLAEAEETLRAVRSGEIDAFIVEGPEGEQVYALRSAEQPYRNLVEDMLEGAAILTTDGDIAYCNRRFAELVAVPLEEVVGGPMERYIHRNERTAYRSLLAAGTGKRRTQLITADGRTIDVFVSFTTSVCDEVERLNLIITDLSELVDAQSGRDRAEQQSQAKDEFMAMLAHELRNPLSAITAAVQVLEAAKAHEGTAARARFIIGRQVQHLARLVDDLLDVGRAVTGKIVLDKRVIDFCDVVRRTAAVFTERGSEHQFEVNCDPPLSIEGDPVRIEQIVSNIIGNAVKYTASGGRISISLCAEADEAVLTVQDTGFGITPELLPRIFDLFVQGERTLERAQGGLGIGLTLVRRLVNLHNGTVSAFSDGANRGSVFTVRLPRVVMAVGDDAGASAGRTRGSAAVHRRVLIVEDNRDAREMFRMMLELDGHDVLEAEEGVTGLQMLRSEMPEVAFIDVGLPGLDGYEIARRFRGEGGGGGASSGLGAAGAGAGAGAAAGALGIPGACAASGLDACASSGVGVAGACADAHADASVATESASDAGGASRAGTHAAASDAGGASGADMHASASDTGASRADTHASASDAGVSRAPSRLPRVLLVALTGYGTPDALERSRRAGFDLHLIKPVNPDTLYKLLNADQIAVNDAPRDLNRNVKGCRTSGALV